MANIYEAIAAIMADCPAITKSQKNQQQGFMYRGVDVVMNVLQPLMIKHKVFVVPEVVESQREERQTSRGGSLIYTTLKVKYTFYADDGSSVCAVVQGEGMDSGDKSSNKAMSVAFKYACFQVFCIPTEEMKDPDADTPPESVKTGAKPKKILCAKCRTEIKPTAGRDGKQYSADDIARMNGGLCVECFKKQKGQNNEQNHN